MASNNRVKSPAGAAGFGDSGDEGEGIMSVACPPDGAADGGSVAGNNRVKSPAGVAGFGAAGEEGEGMTSVASPPGAAAEGSAGRKT